MIACAPPKAFAWRLLDVCAAIYPALQPLCKAANPKNTCSSLWLAAAQPQRIDTSFLRASAGKRPSPRQSHLHHLPLSLVFPPSLSLQLLLTPPAMIPPPTRPPPRLTPLRLPATKRETLSQALVPLPPRVCRRAPGDWDWVSWNPGARRLNRITTLSRRSCRQKMWRIMNERAL